MKLRRGTLACVKCERLKRPIFLSHSIIVNPLVESLPLNLRSFFDIPLIEKAKKLPNIHSFHKLYHWKSEPTKIMDGERRVGVAVDFSPCSKKALKWAIDNVIRKGDYLVLITVRPDGDYEDGEMQLWQTTGSRMISLPIIGDIYRICMHFKLVGVDFVFGLIFLFLDDGPRRCL